LKELNKETVVTFPLKTNITSDLTKHKLLILEKERTIGSDRREAKPSTLPLHNPPLDGSSCYSMSLCIHPTTSLQWEGKQTNSTNTMGDANSPSPNKMPPCTTPV